jgi:hypothetical protein
LSCSARALSCSRAAFCPPFFRLFSRSSRFFSLAARNKQHNKTHQTNRGKNADAFRANFAGVDWVKVPLVYWQYTTSEVLVLEYCPGKKINDGPAIDALGLDRQRLARLAVESYLQQILRHGLFHADPHPGNVAVDAGVEGGRCVVFSLLFFEFDCRRTKNDTKK